VPAGQGYQVGAARLCGAHLERGSARWREGGGVIRRRCRRPQATPSSLCGLFSPSLFTHSTQSVISTIAAVHHIKREIVNDTAMSHRDHHHRRRGAGSDDSLSASSDDDSLAGPRRPRHHQDHHSSADYHHPRSQEKQTASQHQRAIVRHQSAADGRLVRDRRGRSPSVDSRSTAATQEYDLRRREKRRRRGTEAGFIVAVGLAVLSLVMCFASCATGADDDD